jgi:hypothetical protein
VLAAIARVLDVELAALLDASGAPMHASTHLLLYQTGARYRSPLEAARRLFAGRVDAWIELVDPRRSGRLEPTPGDVLARRCWELSEQRSTAPIFETGHALGVLSDVLAEVARSGPAPRLGVVFGGSSAVLRSVANPPALLESEAGWERDVAAACRDAVGVEPAANVCVYREADIQELAPRVDPLATVLSLLQAHPHVAVEHGRAVTIGQAAVETVLAGVRPAGVGSETWDSLIRAAAAGFAHGATLAHPAGRALVE